MDCDVVLLDTLARFATSDPELSNGFAEHTTMGVEAMLTMGVAPELVAEWAARHEPTPLAADGPIMHLPVAPVGGEGSATDRI